MRLVTGGPLGSTGFTIVETLAALAIVFAVLLTGFTAFESSRKSADSGKRAVQAWAIAQREIEDIKGKSYANIALKNPLPTHAASGSTTNNPANPNYYVSGSNFRIMLNYADQNSGGISNAYYSGGYEPMVGGGGSGGVDAQSTVTGVGGGTFTVWRYVTYRREVAVANLNTDVSVTAVGPGGSVGVSLTAALPSLICPPDDASKRVTVAVLPNTSAQHAAPTSPVYISTVLTKPGASLIPLGGPLVC